MSKPLKPRRGTTAEQNAFVGEAYEITYDTDKNTIVCRDGLTAGGFPLAKEGDLNAFKGSQSTRDSQQDEAISAAQTAANNALVSAVIEDGELVLTYGNGTVKRESLPGGLPLGTLMPYTGKDVPAGFLRADGSTYTNMRTAFPEFYNWVVNSGLTVALGSYALVEGSCGFYGLDTSTGTVRMPTLAAGVFGTTVAGQYGQAVQAGLPNITGAVPHNLHGNSNFSGTEYYGAFKSVKEGNFGIGSNSGTSTYVALYIDASQCSPAYGRSDTVQPPHVKYPWIISVYNAAVSASTAQANQFVGLLDGKADVNLGNVTAEGKAAVVGWGMPDYSAGVNITSTVKGGSVYTAPSHGYIIGMVNPNGIFKVKHNGIERFLLWELTNLFIPMRKGDTVQVSYTDETSGGITTNINFFPCGGA